MGNRDAKKSEKNVKLQIETTLYVPFTPESEGKKEVQKREDGLLRCRTS